MRVLVTGDSHCGAWRRGRDLLESLGYDFSGVNIVVSTMCSGRNFRHAFFLDAPQGLRLINCKTAEFPPEKLPGPWDAFVLSFPLHSSRWIKSGVKGVGWAHYQPYDWPHRVRGTAPVSDALMVASLSEDQRYICAFLDAGLRHGLPLRVIEPPRAFRKKPHLRSIPEPLVAHLDQFYRRQMRSELAERRIPIIPVPDAMVDAEGFMLERFSHPNPKDQHHGSNAFAALMIHELVCQLTGRQPVFPELPVEESLSLRTDPTPSPATVSDRSSRRGALNRKHSGLW